MFGIHPPRLGRKHTCYLLPISCLSLISQGDILATSFPLSICLFRLGDIFATAFPLATSLFWLGDILATSFPLSISFRSGDIFATSFPLVFLFWLGVRRHSFYLLPIIYFFFWLGDIFATTVPLATSLFWLGDILVADILATSFPWVSCAVWTENLQGDRSQPNRLQSQDFLCPWDDGCEPVSNAKAMKFMQIFFVCRSSRVYWIVEGMRSRLIGCTVT